jgi:hypothetical protein
MTHRCGPSTTAFGGGPPPHRDATGRIFPKAYPLATPPAKRHDGFEGDM